MFTQPSSSTRLPVPAVCRLLARAALALLALLPLAPASGAQVDAEVAVETEVATATGTGRAVTTRFAPGELERRLERIKERFESERVAGRIPGLALGLVIDDDVVLLQGFGLADVASGRAADAQTLFAIGSSSKAFTATLCAMLVDEGRLAWDDPIARHVPEFTLKPDPGPGAPWGAAPAVSVRDVLSHRTGFSRNDILWAGPAVSRELILATAAKAEPWAPYRTQFLYNNVQVMAAGIASARIEQTDWDSQVTRRLLEPLGMTSTTTSVSAAASDPRLALGYLWDDELQSHRHLPMRRLDSIAPAGSLNSNVTDMVQWVRLQLGRGEVDGKRLVSAAAIEETWSPHIDVGGEGSYGLCWFLGTWQGRRVVEHGGNIDGFAAEVALLPDDGIGFVLLTNVSATPLQQMSRGIVFQELLGFEPASGDAAAGAATASAAALEEYVGAYLCNSPGYRDEEFDVLVKDGKLAIDVPRQMVYTLHAPTAAGRWVFEITDTIELEFLREEGGRVHALIMHQGGLALEMPKVGVEQKPDEDLAPLARLLGEYGSEGTRLSVVIHNQRLSLDIPGQMIYELHPADASGHRSFRALQGFAAEFEERDGVVVAVLSHQPDGTHRFERVRPAGDAAGAGVAGGDEGPLPDVEALHALRGANADPAAWEALRGWRLVGTMRFASAGLTGTLTSSNRGQTHSREETDLGAFGSAHQASDGHSAWSASSFHPWRELTGRELRQSLQTSASFYGDWRTRFADIRVLRRDTQEGRRTVVVELRDGDLPPVTVWVATDTGDLLRVDSEVLLPGGQRLPQSILLSDWRAIGTGPDAQGVRVPFRSLTRNEGIGRIEVQYERAETGLDLPDTLFRLEPPPAATDEEPAPR